MRSWRPCPLVGLMAGGPSSECEDGVTDDAEEAEDEWGDEEEWEREESAATAGAGAAAPAQVGDQE